MVVREKGTIARVVVPARAPGASEGDGWRLEPKPGWKLAAGARAGDVEVEKVW